MGQVPVRRTDGLTLPAGVDLSVPVRPELTLSDAWGIVWRNWWVILGCISVCAALALWLTMRTVPLYQSSMTIRIKDATNEMQSVVREALLPLTSGSEVSTEREVLASRTLTEDAVQGLGLQLSILQPARVARSELLKNVKVAPNSPPWRVSPGSRHDGQVSDTGGEGPGRNRYGCTRRAGEFRRDSLPAPSPGARARAHPDPGGCIPRCSRGGPRGCKGGPAGPGCEDTDPRLRELGP